MKSILFNCSIAIIVATLFSLLLFSPIEAAKSSTEQHQTTKHEPQTPNNDKLRAQSRNADSIPTKKTTADKAAVDMHSVYQQHLVGPNVASAIVQHETTKNEKKDIWSRFGSKEANSAAEGGKKGKLQTVGSVIGDIIGVLVSEIARFFGSVVSDVAREVTAHGFVSLFKQIADLTGISFGSSSASSNGPASVAQSMTRTS